MKHYQRKKIRLVDYILYSIGPIFFSIALLVTIFIGNFGDELLARILCVFMFGSFAVYNYKSLINLFVECKCRGTIEFDDEGVTNKSSKGTIKLRWLEIKEVSVAITTYPIPFNFSSTVIFYDKGYEAIFWTSKISKKRIWAQLTDDMVDDIIKYWGSIDNIGAYNRYKRIADKFNLR